MPNARALPLREPASPAPMIRCECANLEFEDVRRRLVSLGLSVEEALRREGCGQTCTACVPDLVDYLRRSGFGHFPKG